MAISSQGLYPHESCQDLTAVGPGLNQHRFDKLDGNPRAVAALDHQGDDKYGAHRGGTRDYCTPHHGWSRVPIRVKSVLENQVFL